MTDFRRQRIDVHHHVLPKAWMDEAKPHKPDQTWGPNISGWSPAGSIEEMDRHGVAYAITELGLPGVWWAQPSDARRLARQCNEYVAQMGRDYPRRIGMFATLPVPDIEGSLKEIEFALDVLKADGIGMLTSYGDKWPGDPLFEPVFEELNRRKAVVHFHPTVPDKCVNIVPGILSATLEYLFDTSRAITHMLFHKTFLRYPDIKYIFSHAGGTFPMLAWRVEQRIVRDKRTDEYPDGSETWLRKLYFDTATSVSGPTLGALRLFTSIDKILLGTDYPYLPMTDTIPELDATDLTPKDAYAVNTGNALALFPHVRDYLEVKAPA